MVCGRNRTVSLPDQHRAGLQLRRRWRLAAAVSLSGDCVRRPDVGRPFRCLSSGLAHAPAEGHSIRLPTTFVSFRSPKVLFTGVGAHRCKAAFKVAGLAFSHRGIEVTWGHDLRRAQPHRLARRCHCALVQGRAFARSGHGRVRPRDAAHPRARPRDRGLREDLHQPRGDRSGRARGGGPRGVRSR